MVLFKFLPDFVDRQEVIRNRINSWEHATYRKHEIYYNSNPSSQLGTLKASVLYYSLVGEFYTSHLVT